MKDRLYSEAPDSRARRSVQTVLMNILEVLVRIMSPILSFTCDEVWEHYPEAARNRAGRPVSVQLAGWPALEDFKPALPAEADAAALRARFDVLLSVRDAVTKALEDARNGKVVNKSQEAEEVLSPRLTRRQRAQVLQSRREDREEFLDGLSLGWYQIVFLRCLCRWFW